MDKLLAVGLGGFLGAVARYSLSELAHRLVQTAFPLGTLLVNTVGCLLVGVVLGLIEDRQLFAPATRLFLTVGILGGLTTFSAFGYETVELLKTGGTKLAVLNVLANVALGLSAVVVGRSAIGFFEPGAGAS